MNHQPTKESRIKVTQIDISKNMQNQFEQMEISQSNKSLCLSIDLLKDPPVKLNASKVEPKQPEQTQKIYIQKIDNNNINIKQENIINVSNHFDKQQIDRNKSQSFKQAFKQQIPQLKGKMVSTLEKQSPVIQTGSTKKDINPLKFNISSHLNNKKSQEKISLNDLPSPSKLSRQFTNGTKNDLPSPSKLSRQFTNGTSQTIQFNKKQSQDKISFNELPSPTKFSRQATAYTAQSERHIAPQNSVRTSSQLKKQCQQINAQSTIYDSMTSIKKNLFSSEYKKQTSNIKTYVRFRPSADASRLINMYSDSTIQIKQDQFKADQFFDFKAGQEDVYQKVCTDIISDCKQGFNSCLFAYGATGSGKTYSMYGNEENKGIIFRLVSDLFKQLTPQQNVKCSMLEIYNDNLHDILVEDGQKLKIKENSDKTAFVQDLSQIKVKTVSDIQNLINIGNKIKSVRATNVNENSSRSHIIFQILVETVGQLKKHAKINLIDLAGSENLKKSGSQGDGLKETQNINYSLSCLGNVINSLLRQDDHIPFRDSKLTRILQDSLNGNFKTKILVACSSEEKNFSETINSLKFAQRVQALKTTYKTNIEGLPQQSYQQITQQNIQQELKNNIILYQENVEKIKDELHKMNKQNYFKQKSNILNIIQDIDDKEKTDEKTGATEKAIGKETEKLLTEKVERVNIDRLITERNPIQTQDIENYKPLYLQLQSKYSLLQQSVNQKDMQLDVCNKQIDLLHKKINEYKQKIVKLQQNNNNLCNILYIVSQSAEQRLNQILEFQSKNSQIDISMESNSSEMQILLLKQKLILAQVLNFSLTEHSQHCDIDIQKLILDFRSSEEVLKGKINNEIDCYIQQASSLISIQVQQLNQFQENKNSVQYPLFLRQNQQQVQRTLLDIQTILK